MGPGVRDLDFVIRALRPGSTSLQRFRTAQVPYPKGPRTQRTGL